MEPNPPSEAAREAGAPSAVVVAGEEQTRVLFRGLLRLNGMRIVGEADGAAPAVEIVRQQRPDLLVADSVLAQGTVEEIIREGRRARPSLRVVLITPSSRPAVALAQDASADAVLVRPFRIREFTEALAPPIVA